MLGTRAAHDRVMEIVVVLTGLLLLAVLGPLFGADSRPRDGRSRPAADRPLASCAHCR